MSLLSVVILILTLSSSLQSSDSALLNQARQQAEHYISQIQNKQNPDLHLWALAQLCGANSEISIFIDSRLSEGQVGSDIPFQPFCGEQSSKNLVQKLAFQTRSPDLLIAALLEEQTISSQKELRDRFLQEVGFSESSPIRYDELTNRIIQDQAIDSNILPYESFKLTHFLLLFNKKEILPVSYLQKISSAWFTKSPSVSNLTLEKTLLKTALFRALYLTDEYVEIESLYRVLIQDKLFPVSSMRMSLYRALDYSMYRLGYYDRSLEITRTFSVPLTRFLQDKDSELMALMRQGVYLIKIGKMKEAQEINLHVLEQVQQHNIAISQSSLYTNLGITYAKTGNFDKYLELQFKAFEEAKKQTNYTHQLDILNNLYIYYRQNNDPNAALLYLKEANELAEQYGSKEDMGVIYTLLGTFYKKFKQNYALSLEYYDRAEAVLDKKSHFNYYLNLLYEKGKLYEEVKKYDLALNKFDEVITLSQSKSVRHYFESLTSKAAVHLKLNKLEQVSSLISEINSHDFSQFDFRHIVKAKTIHASYLVKTGQPDEAYLILKPVIHQTVEWAQNSTDIQSGFWNVEQEFLDVFQLTADLLIETNRTEGAVEVLDKLKTINDAALYQNPMVKSSLLSESELSQYQRLTDRLDGLRKRLLAASQDKQLELQTHIDQLSARKRALDRKITTMADRKPVSINEVQSSLSGYEAVIHTTELNDRYYIATIFRNEVRFKKVSVDSSLRSVFHRSAEHLASGKTNLNDLYQISEVLGFHDLPSWIEKITIIPDSYLYQLPVDVLPLTKPESSYSYGGTTYLIERFNTHYLTSLNDFNIPSGNRADYKWDFIGYGVSDFQSYTGRNLVPLPYAQTEVSHILNGLTNVPNKIALLDSSSTEAAFKTTAPDARILHLATHSEVSEHDPLFSSIYLSQQQDSSQKNDFAGQIFAYELFELNLANDLIMLNSCESGSGSYLQGSGIMGISRALRYAGANSVILNLWSVNDMMASDFAIHFYDRLNEGRSKAEALRDAKLRLLKNNNANPHYWGTYMLIGKNNSVVNPSEKTNVYLASSFILYFIVLITITFIKRNGQTRDST